eukprot:1183745-Amorphochlora_amoeboformis.AAC.1
MCVYACLSDAREKQLLRMWVNNMGVENKYIHRLLPACANGVVLLRILDKLSGGKVGQESG